MKFKLDPTKFFAGILIIMSVLAIGFNFHKHSLLHFIATLGLGLILYAVYGALSGKRKNLWNTVITCLIIFFLLDYGSGNMDMFYSLFATFIAMTMKFFLDWKGSPVINPAVAGLLLTVGLAAIIPNADSVFISWWGASFQGWISLVVVALWMVIGIKKWSKWPAVLSFLIAHAAILILRGMERETLEFIFSDSTIYFMASFMLIEPKTSPIAKKEQIVFGLIAALTLNFFMQAGLSYGELFAIGFANVSFALMRIIRKKKKRIISACS